MYYLVTYDISLGKTRLRAVKLCKQAGLIRLQKSVFLGSTTPALIAKITTEMKPVLHPKTDSLCITPLHIGNGDELHSLDYVVHQSRFYRVGQGQFLSFLKTLGKDAATRFSDWVLEKTETIENLKEEKEQERKNRQHHPGRKRDFNQELSNLHRQFNYLTFAEMIGQKEAFLQFLRSGIIPSIPIYTEQLKQQVRGLIRTADGKAYLPGTSLKGVIRTALLFYLLDNKHIPIGMVKDILDKATGKVREDKKKAQREGNKFSVEKAKANFAEKLEHEAFYCKMKNDRGEVKSGEEQYDLFKLLLVSDTYPEKQSLGVDNIDLYLVSKTRERNSNKMTTIADVQRQAPGVEVIAEGMTFNCHIEFNIDFLLTIKHMLNGGQINNKGAVHWIGIEEKVKKLFNLDIESLTEANKEEKRATVLSHILECVKKFSLRQIQHDREWLKNFYEHDKARRFNGKLKEGFSTTLSRPNATLFNLGYASGFQGTTELLFLIEYCKPELKAIMELFSIGDKPGAGKTRKPGETYIANPARFPKSKRLITRQQEILPPGWLVLLDGQEAQIDSGGRLDGEKTPVEEPENPSFPKTPIRQNLEIYAEIVQCGKPNKIKLLISETNQPLLELRYGLGFPIDKLGNFIVVRISAMKGKDSVQAVTFVRFARN